MHHKVENVEQKHHVPLLHVKMTELRSMRNRQKTVKLCTLIGSSR